MDALRDPEEFGRRVAAARAYLGEKKPAFAKRMGVSVPTLTRWEQGAIGSIGATVPQRRQLAERVIEATSCPPSWFGLSEPDEAAVTEILRRLEAIEGSLPALRKELTSEFARDIGALGARLQRLEHGGGAEAGAGG